MRYIFIYKKPDTLCYGIFHRIFEIHGGEGHFFKQKTMHFALNFYMQKTMHFPVRFIYKTPDTLRHIFILRNNALCVTFLYLKFMNQSDQIDK